MKHVPALDVGAVSKGGKLFSVRDADEFFVITQHTAGASYHLDLERVAKTGRLAAGDLPRARALADYLVKIHSDRKGGGQGVGYADSGAGQQATGHATDPDPDPQASWFQLIRGLDGATCADVLNARSSGKLSSRKPF